MALYLQARELFTPLERIPHPLVCIEDGVVTDISSVGSRELPPGSQVMNFGDGVLAPGFIDMHIHGGAGRDVMDADRDALPAIEMLLCQHGVTTYFPTTITAPVDRTLAALDRLADAIENSDSANGSRAKPAGIHLEGPFISHARPGVHPPPDLLRPTLEMFERFWQAARGHIKVLTIAPELEGATAVIAEATRRGICVSMGHSDADLAAAQSGVAAGVRHATHTFNAMRPLGHRDPGILGETLMSENLSAEIIADGVHVAPLMVRLFLRLKGPESAVLVTDATAATGMPDGRYRLGSLEVEVKNGMCKVGDQLAGSVLTLDKAVQNVVKFANWDLAQAVRLATANPARTLALPAKSGMLVPGAIANIVALSPQGDVLKTIVGGHIT
jgi:N-acetylglucosamine-6-phosphate deacetylase